MKRMSENTNNISEQLSIEYGFLNEDDERNQSEALS